ncbi:MAG: hypothetical protein LUQ09_08580 [Methanomassiliicoccales archaeon]|nr:hypothetical protein [Methanomassiliicoccales archaeon]
MDKHCQIVQNDTPHDNRPDIVLKGSGTTVFVDIKTRASVDAISRLALISRLARDAEGEVKIALAVKSISDDLLGLAESAGIRVIMLSRGACIDLIEKKVSRDRLKITTDKSWRIISRLLQERPTSVRSVAMAEEVSYGWAHAVIQYLIEKGIAERNGNRVDLVNMDQLINGISWERPFKKLIVKDIRTDIDDVFNGAREIGRTFAGPLDEHAFTGHMAGSLYTGQAIRFDRLQIYLPENAIRSFEDIYATKDGSGVTIQVLIPDREVWMKARTVDGIKIVSPAQTLLDLASMGYGATELTRAMVKSFADL